MTPDVIGAVGCPSCGEHVAEPEQDGDLTYYACTGCSYEFGWQHRRANDDTCCAVGIPEPLRRRASTAAEHALASAQPLLLQIGKRPT